MVDDLDPEDEEFVLRSRELLQRSRDLILSSHLLLQRLKREQDHREAPGPPEPPPPPG
ncbi:MAG TPA: hypothetical protein VF665_10010 [Longimicrobium sp.]|jgi:hypothetical protein|uniref:hypothetical protein n=1 Tax=Longimicrobium sp. TaxID=2029185 RepID=UPI002ED8E441